MDADDLEERENPDPSDMDDPDEADTIDCPHCGQEIAEEAEWCPKCGEYLSREEMPLRPATWFVIGVIVAILIMTVWWVL